MNKKTICLITLTIALGMAFALQWIIITGVTLAYGSELVIEDPATTLIAELVISTAALLLGIVTLVIFFKWARRPR